MTPSQEQTDAPDRWPRPDWIRPLGRTGLQVSALCLGGGPLGSMPAMFGEVPPEQAVQLVRTALDSPVRWIDTSNGYGGGESERRIGRALTEHGGLPADYLVATKVDARDGDYSGERVRASVAESRERLGLDQLPLVYLHDPEFHDFDALAAPGGAVQTLMRLREEGVVGHVGLAGGDTRVMTRYLELGGFEVLLVHNRWTLVDHSAEELIALAESQQVAVVNAAIMGGGLLGDPYTSTTYAYREADPAVVGAARAMADACREAGTDLASAALRVSTDDPRVTATVVGTTRPGRLDALVAAAATALPPGLAETLADLRPDPRYWLDRD